MGNKRSFSELFSSRRLSFPPQPKQPANDGTAASSSYLSNLEIAQHPTPSPSSSARLPFFSHLQANYPSILQVETSTQTRTMRLLQLLVPLIPLASLVPAENILEARSAYTTSVIATVTVTVFTGTTATHATPTQETQGGGGNDNGRTVVSSFLPSNSTNRISPLTQANPPSHPDIRRNGRRRRPYDSR